MCRLTRRLRRWKRRCAACRYGWMWKRGMILCHKKCATPQVVAQHFSHHYTGTSGFEHLLVDQWNSGASVCEFTFSVAFMDIVPNTPIVVEETDRLYPTLEDIINSMRNSHSTSSGCARHTADQADYQKGVSALCLGCLQFESSRRPTRSCAYAKPRICMSALTAISIAQNAALQ